MILPCLLPNLNACCPIRMPSPASDPNPRGTVSSAIRRRASSLLNDAQKNSLSWLWSGAFGLVRSQTPPCARSVVRRHPGVSRRRGAARLLSSLRHGEAGAARLLGRQSAVQEALCLLFGTALCERHDQGRGPGVAAPVGHAHAGGGR